MEELAKTAKQIPAEARDAWGLDHCLKLAQKADRARCEREFLETLLRPVVASGVETSRADGAYDMTQSVIRALAWVILEKNLVGHEKDLFLPGPPQMPGPQGPGGAAGALHRWSVSSGDLYGMALAAIDSYEDDRGREFLVDVALRRPRAGKYVARKEWAIGFLACYDWRATEPKVKTAYEAPHANESWSEGPYEISLRIALDEMRYIKTLQPAAQKRYQHILRILLRASAVAPQGMMGNMPARYASRSFLQDWQDGDERFLPHMIEMRYARIGLPGTNRGVEAVPTGMVVGGPISTNGLAWLKEQADSGDWPARVKKELGTLLRQREKLQEKTRENWPRESPLTGKDKVSKKETRKEPP
jgi:hypothetical protein